MTHKKISIYIAYLTNEKKEPSNILYLARKKFGLVSLFNSISTFMGYLMSKLVQSTGAVEYTDCTSEEG